MKYNTPKLTHAFAAFAVFACLTLLCFVDAQAQTNIWTNPITGANPNTSNPYTNGQTVASDITVSGIGRGSGITGSNANDRYSATGWSTGSIDLNDYFTFTLTPNSGYEIDFDSFVFSLQRSATGPRDIVLRSNLDSYASNIWSTNTPAAAGTYTGLTADLTGASFQNITNAIEFRLYGYTSGAAGGTLSVNDFAFKGTVNSAPPPVGNDLYWTANGSSLGGAGTWDNSGSNWSATESPVTGAAWDSTKTAVFTNNAATVTVSNVTVEKGIQFATTGYVLTNGTITLGGAAISDNTITTDASVAATIDSKLSGSTGLTKSGSGTLILGGANDYTGGTLVNAGDLAGTTGSVQGNVTNNAKVVFDQTSSGTYAGIMSGSGVLVKEGSGTVTLSGENTYSGGTLVSAGRLVGDTHSLHGGITNNAAVSLNQSTNGTYAGIMSGSGSLTKEGSGTVTLSGANTYSGGTLVSAGGLVGDTHSLQGSITNDATVSFNQTTNGTYTGVMSGTGTLIKHGSGKATLSGANTYSGGTLVSSGELAGTTTSLQGNITNNAKVAFDQSYSGTYADVMSGSGALEKLGSGTVTLSGNNTYAGGTTVKGGTIIADHDNALGTGDVDIQDSSVLANDGVTIANNFNIAGGKGADTRLQAWDFTGEDNVATSSADVIDSALNSGVGFNLLTRGSGAAASTGNNSFRTTGFKNDGISLANNDYFEWEVAASTGNKLYLSSLDARFAGTATFSATPGVEMVFAYSLDGVTYTQIGSTFSKIGDGPMSQIDLSGITALQGLDSSTTVTFRYFASGQTSTGGWGFHSPSSGSYGLDVGGYAGSAVAGGTLGIAEAGTAIYSGNIANASNAELTAVSGGQATFSGVVSGSGTVNKTGEGTVSLSGSSANTYTGKTTVSAGMLELAKDANTTAIAGALEIKSSAILLISANEQINNTSAITLSGGTINRASGVTETMGDLSLTANSTINYGNSADSGFLQFGAITLGGNTLTVENFREGNQLKYNAADAAAGLALANSFTFSGSDTWSHSFDSGVFSITAVPEASTVLAALGLTGVLLWPTRRRLLKDAKSILGLRAPFRDRLSKR